MAGRCWRFMNCVKWEVSGIYIHLFHLLVWLAFILPICTQKGGKKIPELQTKEQQNQFKRKLAVLLSLSTESLTLSHGTFHIETLTSDSGMKQFERWIYTTRITIIIMETVLRPFNTIATRECDYVIIRKHLSVSTSAKIAHNNQLKMLQIRKW